MSRSIVHSGICKFLAAVLLLLVPLRPLRAEIVWQLPAEVSTESVQVKFELDTTWHKVHGVLHQQGGQIYLADPADPLSVRGELRFPVLGFDTDNASRDSELRDVMQMRRFPEVIFRITGLKDLPTPGVILSQKSATGVLLGELQIRDVKRSLEIPIQVKAGQSDFEVSGLARFSWADFGVEDPSIFIAKVEKQMRVLFTARLPILIKE